MTDLEQLQLRVAHLEEKMTQHIEDAFPGSDVESHHDDHKDRAKRCEWIAGIRDKVVTALAISAAVATVGWISAALWVHFLAQVKA